MAYVVSEGKGILPQFFQSISEGQCPSLSGWIFRQLPSVVSWDFTASVQVIKKETVAITALFLSALGLLPAWLSVACVIYGVARFVWIISQTEAQRVEWQEMRDRIGRLTLENEDLRHARDQAVNERNATELSRGTLHREKEVLSLEHRHAVEQLEQAHRALERAQAQLRELQGEHHDIEQQEREARGRLENALNAQVEILQKENRDQTVALQRKEEVIERMRAGRDEAAMQCDEAIRERGRLRQELEEIRMKEDPFRAWWLDIEQRRSEALGQISALCQKVVKTGEEDHCGYLETLVRQLIPDLQDQKRATITLVEEAIRQTAPANPALSTRLAKLKGIYEMERESLENIATVFALPAYVRQWLVPPHITMSSPRRCTNGTCSSRC